MHELGNPTQVQGVALDSVVKAKQDIAPLRRNSYEQSSLQGQTIGYQVSRVEALACAWTLKPHAGPRRGMGLSRQAQAGHPVTEEKQL